MTISPSPWDSAQRAFERSVALLEDCRRVMASQRGAVPSRPEIAAGAWGSGCAGRHGEVEVYVGRLRRKLELAGSPPRIQTVRGRGYLFLAG